MLPCTSSHIVVLTEIINEGSILYNQVAFCRLQSKIYNKYREGCSLQNNVPRYIRNRIYIELDAIRLAKRYAENWVLRVLHIIMTDFLFSTRYKYLIYLYEVNLYPKSYYFDLHIYIPVFFQLSKTFQFLALYYSDQRSAHFAAAM